MVPERRRHLKYRNPPGARRFRRSLLTLILVTASPACGRPQLGVVTSDNAHQIAQESPRSTTGETAASLDTCIFVVFQASDGTYWFGSDGQGVYRYDGASIVRFTKEHGLAGDRIRSIQEDRAGNILVGGEGGVSRFDGRVFEALRAVNADPHKGEWRLDPDDLWFTGWQDQGVVYRYDGAALHRLSFPKTEPGEAHIAQYPRAQFPAMAYSPYDVYTIYRDGDGHLWFGTGTLGACRYDGQSFAWASRDELDLGDNGFGVRSIIEDKNGHIWFSRTTHRFDVVPPAPEERGNTLLRYRKEPGVVAASSPAKDAFTHIMSAVKDKDGVAWMATLDGSVWRYDGESFAHYPVRKGETIVRLYAIYQDNFGGLWLGTHEHGAYKFNGEAFEPFRPQR